MKTNDLIKEWQSEERVAKISGWDFSHIAGRYAEDTDFSWNFRNTVRTFLTPDKKLLDTDTGGGEFLRSLGHPYENTSATENYPPNVEFCRRELTPLGIDFRQANANVCLPFGDASFDVVINRHGDFNAREIHRVLKKGGVFATQQVGAENDRELVSLLLPKESALPFPEQYAASVRKKFVAAGFEITDCREEFRSIRFFDVGALVWFARIIEWEFRGFSVDSCTEQLMLAQKLIEKDGYVEGKTHRFLLVAKKAF